LRNALHIHRGIFKFAGVGHPADRAAFAGSTGMPGTASSGYIMAANESRVTSAVSKQ
jgi:hypothetical protein